MAKLVFHVQADYEEVIRLRNEIEKLKKELKGMDAMQSPAAFNTLNAQLSTSTRKMDDLVTEAAKAGAVMEGDFKKKIFDASQVVNSLSEKITLQRGTIQQLKNELSSLKDKYRETLKQDGNVSALETQIKEVSAKLRGQKEALFNLTQEQANARLSVKKLRDEYELFRNDSKETTVVTEGIGFSLKKAFAVIGGAALGKQFISDMVRVRGEFQAADTAIQTLLGSKEKADSLMSQVREYAKISPLEFSDVTQATQMMLGFNIEAEKVPRFLQAIGDVSMGDTQKFNSLTLAFSQMSAAGKLMGQDLNQMINAGFNPLQTMSEKTGKSIAQLKDEMSKGAISAEMVQQAFIDATSAGGKFYKMSENATKTINGQLSMMQDAMDAAFNEMGQKSEGFIMSGIQMTTSLIENYETVGKVLVGLVATYGAYKAALITNIALTKSWAVAARADAVAKGIQTAATKAQTVAQLALNAAMKANPYVLLVTVIVGLVAAMWALRDSTSAAEKELERLNKREEENKKAAEERKDAIDKAISSIQDETKSDNERRKALMELHNLMPSVFSQYKTEKQLIDDITNAKRASNAELERELELKGKQDFAEDKRTLKAIEDYYKDLSLLQKGAISKEEYARRNSFGGLRNEYKRMFNLDSDPATETLINWAEKTLPELRKTVNKEMQKMREAASADWNTDLLKKNVEELQRGIAFDEDVIKRLEKSGKKYITLAGDVYPTSIAELRRRVRAAKEQIKQINENAGKDFLKDAEKNWKDAEQKVKDIISNRGDRTLYPTEDVYQKALEKARQDEKAAKSRYEGLGGVTGKSGEKNLKAVEEWRKKEEEAEKKANEELLKLKMENRNAQLDLEEETTEKKLKLIALSYDKQKAEIEKKERELAEQNKKAGIKGLNEKGLTAEQQSEIDKANEINDKTREKQIADMYKAELTAMRDYLKEYGTFQQQKLAITEEYAEKISKAQTEGERKSLEKERDKNLQNISDNKIVNQIDWVTTFGKLGTTFDDLIKNALTELNAYVKTDEFKSRTAEEQKTILDAQNQLQGHVANDATFDKLNKQIEVYRQNLAELKALEDVHKTAIEARMRAEQERDKIEDKGSKEYEEANQKVVAAMQEEERTADIVMTADNAVAEAQYAVADTASKLQTNLDNFSTGLNQLTSGTLSGTVDGLTNLFKSLGMSDDIMKGFKDTLETGLSALFGEQVGSLLAGSLDLVEGFLTGDLQEAIISGVLGMIDNILDGILKGGFITKPVKALVGGLGNIANTITFGGFDSWFGIGGNKKEVEETINKLTERNEILTDSIDRLTDELGKTSGMKAVEEADKAKKQQQEKERNLLDMMKAQMSYWNSHHSFNAYWEGFSKDQIADFADQIGRPEWDGNLTSLTADEAAKLLENPEMVEIIKKTGKGGYGSRVLERLKDYAAEAGVLLEIEEQLNESLTQTSFDSLRSDFINSLMDMKKNAKDFSEDFTKMLMQSVLNARIADEMEDELSDFYKDWAKRSEDGLDDRDIEALKAQWNDIVQAGITYRDEVAAVTGYDKISSEASQQTASGKGFQTMSQDTGEELNGRFTAMYESDLRQESAMGEQTTAITAIKDSMLSLYSKVDSIENIADDTRTIIADSYLELVQISENTGNSAKYLKDIKADIAEVKRNTSRL